MIVNITKPLVLTLVSMMVLSCSKDPLEFKSPEDAVAVYKSFYEEIKERKTSDGENLTKDIVRWQELTDTVFNYLCKDSVFVQKQNLAMQFYAYSDSIRRQFFRLSETWEVSYSDVYNIKTGTSSWAHDEELLSAVEEATPFFASLDKKETPSMKKDAALYKYREFLKDVLRNGINDKKELLYFIEREDLLYRTFLSHLYEMDKDKLSDITKNTETICINVFQSAREGKLEARDVMVYMSMRTVRRILQNSFFCIQDINNFKMKSKAQGNAYLWMIIQPYTSIDEFSIATLTPTDKENFRNISLMLPNSIQFASTFEIDPVVLRYLLPQQLLKMYIMNINV